MRLDILISYSYSESKDKDLYVTGDLYENDVVTPAMIVVPRRRLKEKMKIPKTETRRNCVERVQNTSVRSIQKKMSCQVR
ncbi:hypothetical protein JHK87_006697 [Glycine soja]|nr:hypothetical protein JHK87_006697 [Glycine soja]